MDSDGEVSLTLLDATDLRELARVQTPAFTRFAVAATGVAMWRGTLAMWDVGASHDPAAVAAVAARMPWQLVDGRLVPR